MKLGIIKYFVKAIEQTGPSFSYFVKKFSEINAANLNEAVFTGPQIRKLLRNEQSDGILCRKQKMVWNDFRLVTTERM
jgi:hypothetical protein